VITLSTALKRDTFNILQQNILLHFAMCGIFSDFFKHFKTAKQ
jgi:hypothetical protein